MTHTIPEILKTSKYTPLTTYIKSYWNWKIILLLRAPGFISGFSNKVKHMFS